ncbi:hypothetical protein TGAMA5MH_02888 [Trichoderma gamsii]|uniref:ADF-H domain-containing protein n=3 Tax=Trichoderma TaxID=5543 RepID=A0A2K0TJF5_9HYPO|nr:hypothetical protein TGAMA5MH_02888 [Trichoderma gamsii]
MTSWLGWAGLGDAAKQIHNCKSRNPGIEGSGLRCGCLFTASFLQRCTLYSCDLTQSVNMASESRLYQISGETKSHLLKFRLTTSRASKPQAVIYLIDKNTHEIRQDDDKTVYTSLDEIADDLPDSTPRFIFLSYPLTMPDGRLSVPYTMIYYLPINCNAATRMLYAGAKELIRNTAEVNKVIDIESAEDLEDIPKQLSG